MYSSIIIRSIDSNVFPSKKCANHSFVDRSVDPTLFQVELQNNHHHDGETHDFDDDSCSDPDKKVIPSGRRRLSSSEATSQKTFGITNRRDEIMMFMLNDLTA